MSPRCYLAAFIALVLTTAACASTSTNSKLQKFIIRPNIPDSVVISLGSHQSCEFSWEATGGTSEDWEIKLDAGEDGLLRCNIARPNQESYLFVTSWKAKLSVPSLSDVLVRGENGDPLPENVAWRISRNRVSNKKGWSGIVHGVSLSGAQGAPPRHATPDNKAEL